MAFGCLVGAARLTDCVEYSPRRFARDPWARGPWCWLLEGAVAFPEPLPWVGQVGLWRAEVTEALREQLEAVGLNV
jgi:hypothetical protein